MKRSRSGLTLIETMLALAILVMGLVAVFDSLFSSSRATQRATNIALAYQEIQAQIESLNYLPFSSIKKSFRGIGFDVSGLKPTLAKAGLPCGTVTNLANPNPYAKPPVYPATAVNPNAFLSTQNTLPLRFKVEWEDSSGPMSVTVVYVLAYRGI